MDLIIHINSTDHNRSFLNPKIESKPRLGVTTAKLWPYRMRESGRPVADWELVPERLRMRCDDPSALIAGSSTAMSAISRQPL